MATIKPIEGRSVHQIQSGQVIVDLCSVVKELVENSLDAGATSIEVRFKNDGLDTIEVQDNGSGIEPENYENIALKHYTSKLASYDDLTSLTTFGFRGEALSSLCAVSDFHIVTAQAQQAPKANKLEFEHSGKLKGTQVVAGQKGTTVSISNLFARLPVRRKELEKNIKRELAKVVNLLNEYACISTGVRFSVKNTDLKKRQLVLLTTKANASIRDNIANVYGAKTLLTLIPLELDLEFEPSATGMRLNRDLKKIHVRGYVSRPVVGEGRGTRDRQMYYVNSRPCGIPQIAKAFNEVYKSYNLTQAPFVLADFQMDTNAYDVNVSPDKRTILLHESASLIESLKEALDTMFQQAEQTVPQSQYASHTPQTNLQQKIRSSPVKPASEMNQPDYSLSQENGQIERVESEKVVSAADEQEDHTEEGQEDEINDSQVTTIDADADKNAEEVLQRIRARAAESTLNSPELPISSLKRQSSTRETGVIENAFDRMRSRRPPAEVATITIGDKVTTSVVGHGVLRKRDSFTAGHAESKRQSKRRVHKPSRPNIFGQNFKSFAAPGTQTQPHDEETDDDADEIAGSSDEEVLYDSPSPVESDESPRDSSSVEDVRESIADEIETSTQEVASRDTNDDAADEEDKRAQEEAKVEELIRKAEEKGVPQSEIHIKRGKYIEKDQKASKDSTANLVGVLETSLVRIQQQLSCLQKRLSFYGGRKGASTDETILAGQQKTGEERLSLTVSKDDFAKMRIVGQFNLGFILATRSHQGEESTPSTEDELFIIDQHASDEKYNFERFQAETVVQYQRLVHPKVLELTAVEEEIIRENQQALEKNGFIVEIDDSGDEPVGRRCRLVSLPLSKEVVFGIKDLEELIVLLSEAPPGASTGKRSTLDMYVPRPSKVRKMFAMRACRSSIMIGKTLTMKQMERAVRHLGEIDKPWNCPHGRPTMRHLMSLGSWHDYDEHTWSERLNTIAEDSRNPWQRFYDQWEQEEQEDEEEEDNEDE